MTAGSPSGRHRSSKARRVSVKTQFRANTGADHHKPASTKTAKRSPRAGRRDQSDKHRTTGEQKECLLAIAKAAQPARAVDKSNNLKRWTTANATVRSRGQ
jgi:hypothetical protein